MLDLDLLDLDLLIELTDFYDVDIRELIDGERKSKPMDKEIKNSLVKVPNYAEGKKESPNKKNVPYDRRCADLILCISGA